MESRPSNISRRRSNMTGCMGGFVHLFDFNQALAGRKLLANKYGSEGLDVLNKSSDDGMAEKAKMSSRREVHNGNSPSFSKRPNEAPIKALIAEELSKEPSSLKNGAPSVVARLMGIDAIPNDIKNKQKMEKGEKFVPKKPSGELLNTKRGVYCSPENMNNVVSPHNRGFSKISLAQRLNEGEYTISLDAERDLNEHEEHYTSKVWELENSVQMQALDDLDAQLPAKLCETNSFVKFLERSPSSSVERNLQCNEDNAVYENVGSFTKMCRKKYAKSQSSFKSDARNSSAFSSASFFTENQHKQSFPITDHDKTNIHNTAENHISEYNQQVPTRIVVLKPGPTSVRNMKYFSQENRSSSKEFLKAMEIMKENSVGVLHDLKERLFEQGDELRHYSMELHYHQHKLPKLPREIAREIANRVRDSVTKDLIDNKVNLNRKLHYDDSDCILGQGYVSSGREDRNKSFSSQNSSTIDITRAEKEIDGERSSISVRSLENALMENSYLENFPNNSRRHSVDETYLRQRYRNMPSNVDIDIDSSSYSGASEGQLDDGMYRRFLRRSFSLHGEKEEGISGRNGLGSKTKYSKGRMHKGKSKLGEEDIAIWESRRHGCMEIEKDQCQIDDAGPVLESDSASSTDNSLSLESSLKSLNCRSGMESLAAGSSSMYEIFTPAGAQDRQSTETIEDSEAMMRSPSTSPRGTMKLSSDGTTVTNLKLNKDVCEQPSPVSVLDVPSHEESPNLMHFADIRSRLHELRSRLQLSKFIDNETSSNPDTCQDDDSRSTDEDKSITNSFHLEITEADHMENVDMLIDGIQCPQGKEQELLYVRDLLVASGFGADNAIPLGWDATNPPIAYGVFERMEDNYRNDSRFIRNGNLLPYHTQHILFNIVNEVLLKILGPESNNHRWWKAQFGPTFVMPSGKLLVERVWAGVCQVYSSSSDAQDTLGNLVAKDLSGRERWLDYDLEFEALMFEVERAIVDDLMLETLHCLGSLPTFYQSMECGT